MSGHHLNSRHRFVSKKSSDNHPSFERVGFHEYQANEVSTREVPRLLSINVSPVFGPSMTVTVTKTKSSHKIKSAHLHVHSFLAATGAGNHCLLTAHSVRRT